MKLKKVMNRIICSIFGHKPKLITKIYTRDGRRFVFEGNLYRCERCCITYVCYGITIWELTDIFQATLKDIPGFPVQLYQSYSLFNELYNEKYKKHN